MFCFLVLRGGIIVNKTSIKNVLLVIVGYLIVCWLAEFIVEKIAWWIFSTTPAKSPFIIAIINSSIIIGATNNELEDKSVLSRRIRALIYTCLWGLFLLGDIMDLFGGKPANPGILDFIGAIFTLLFPPTPSGIISETLCFFGCLYLLFKTPAKKSENEHEHETEINSEDNDVPDNPDNKDK